MPTSFELPDVSGVVLGVLGGTGDLGRGLAARFAAAGQQVVIGSRDAERAVAAAQSLPLGGGSVRGADNLECARAADVVVVAVPWDGHAALLEGCGEALDGKVVVDCVNPLGFDERGAYALPVEEGSACLQAQRLLPGSRVVGAFHHISAVVLLDPQVESLDLDVMVVGDDREATDTVQALASRLPGVRGVYAGRLRSAAQVEALTANLISVNRRHRTHAGIRVTGL
ncbi:NADPH-dependent F420 reductase [Motilibacter aurantiacus]|uniref:NADPH-dependent F420 reductase n=1 Tax=Motilibacter aurantiacus TaxID=2714955 RepID=UPI0014077FF2|nr:NADPH-dependent F420 reductase [Motilibacter aurantiacus]NHC44967.1 NADPH-dependent F420 reductase [Motilibacter aurantiacus]